MMQTGGPGRSVMMGQSQGIPYLLVLTLLLRYFCFTDWFFNALTSLYIFYCFEDSIPCS